MQKAFFFSLCSDRYPLVTKGVFSFLWPGIFYGKSTTKTKSEEGLGLR